jgi:hypothetical protein
MAFCGGAFMSKLSDLFLFLLFVVGDQSKLNRLEPFWNIMAIAMILETYSFFSFFMKNALWIWSWGLQLQAVYAVEVDSGVVLKTANFDTTVSRESRQSLTIEEEPSTLCARISIEHPRRFWNLAKEKKPESHPNLS